MKKSVEEKIIEYKSKNFQEIKGHKNNDSEELVNILEKFQEKMDKPLYEKLIVGDSVEASMLLHLSPFYSQDEKEFTCLRHDYNDLSMDNFIFLSTVGPDLLNCNYYEIKYSHVVDFLKSTGREYNEQHIAHIHLVFDVPNNYAPQLLLRIKNNTSQLKNSFVWLDEKQIDRIWNQVRQNTDIINLDYFEKEKAIAQRKQITQNLEFNNNNNNDNNNNRHNNQEINNNLPINTRELTINLDSIKNKSKNKEGKNQSFFNMKKILIVAALGGVGLCIHYGIKFKIKDRIKNT